MANQTTEARPCDACGGALSGPDAPFPRCVACQRWEDDCSCAVTTLSVLALWEAAKEAVRKFLVRYTR